MNIQRLLQYVAIFIAVLIVLPAHEFAHAYAAVKSGDDTPKVNGRLTLNPMAHFDIVGLFMLIFAHFGWAKPVPINPLNFRDLKKGYFWTSVAGVLTNIAMAFVVYPLYALYSYFWSKVGFDFLLFDDLLAYVLFFVFTLNINLFVFNLIPVYPLDGFRVVEVFNKKRGKVFQFLRDKGQIVLLVLIIISAIRENFDTVLPFLKYVDLFGWFMETVAGLVAFPIELFWNYTLSLFGLYSIG